MTLGYEGFPSTLITRGRGRPGARTTTACRTDSSRAQSPKNTRFWLNFVTERDVKIYGMVLLRI